MLCNNNSSGGKKKHKRFAFVVVGECETFHPPAGLHQLFTPTQLIVSL
jgi:hypothetical protein